MTPAERELVAAYEAERHREPGRPRPAAFAAGWFVNRYGSAEVALRAWLNSGAKLAGVSDAAQPWVAEVTRLLREAAGEGAS